MAVSGIPEMSVSGTIPEVRLKVDMIQQIYSKLVDLVEHASGGNSLSSPA